MTVIVYSPSGRSGIVKVPSSSVSIGPTSFPSLSLIFTGTPGNGSSVSESITIPVIL